MSNENLSNDKENVQNYEASVLQAIINCNKFIFSGFTLSFLFQGIP